MDSKNKNIENDLDLDFYISMNNDVAARFKYKYEEIKNHFLKVGYQENRLYSKEQSNLFYFNDWIKYLNINEDIINQKINNEMLAFKHYLEHGKNEKRKIYPKQTKNHNSVNITSQNKYEIIDLDFAKKMNKELSNLSEKEIIKYIDLNNKKEFLLFTINHKNLYLNYDWELYLKDYPDLKINKIFTVKDAINHFVNFGSKEGRTIKPINKIDKVAKKIIKDNTCKNFLNKINENNENLLQLFKNNILDNSNNLDLKKYDVADIKDINKIYEILCLDFDYKYYYKINSIKYELKNEEEYCINHFFENGVKNYLPYSKSHYLLLLNYKWDEFSIENKNNYDSYLEYIKLTYYYNENIDLPDTKYPINQFINEFYNIAYGCSNENILISYKNFLKNENKNKIFPNLFNYFLYSIINWDSFSKDNNLDCKLFEMIYLLKESEYDFSKYKIEFNTIINLNIPDKKSLVNLEEFNDFYNKIVVYIKNNKSIYNFAEINKKFKKLFNKNLFDIPKKFEFMNFIPYKSNKILNLNIIINYINKYDSLYTLLLSVFYQNCNNYKIIILNKCSDPDIDIKIKEIKESLNISNEIFIIDNDELNNNLNIYNDLNKENDNSKFITLKNIIRNFDINLLIDTNHYFINNNVLEKINKLYDTIPHIFEKILIENNQSKKNFKNSFVCINTNNLINNLYLLNNYDTFEFNKELVDEINKIIILNDYNFVDNNFYNTDLELNYKYNKGIPIYILYSNNENLKYINNLLNYNLIEIKDDDQFNNFLIYLNDNNIYNYIHIIYIDKILENFNLIKFEVDDLDSYNLINTYENSKRKNMKKTSKTIPKINSYDSFLINSDLRINYLKSYKS